MVSKHLHLLLADDDLDDCLFFNEALSELPLYSTLTTVHNGEQLMELLINKVDTPHHVLFLDLNMPRKNGFECLTEIKLNTQLKNLPVIVFSTSMEMDIVNLLYKNGAQFYIRKPVEFSHLKKVILQTINLVMQENISQPTRDNFVLSAHSSVIV